MHFTVYVGYFQRIIDLSLDNGATFISDVSFEFSNPGVFAFSPNQTQFTVEPGSRGCPIGIAAKNGSQSGLYILRAQKLATSDVLGTYSQIPLLNIFV